MFIEILVEQLRSCLFVNAWWMKGVMEKVKKKRERNVSQLSDILICKSTGFFFQHDNKSLLLLHFWLLIWSDFYSMLYEFRIEFAIFLFYYWSLYYFVIMFVTSVKFAKTPQIHTLGLWVDLWPLSTLYGRFSALQEGLSQLKCVRETELYEHFPFIGQRFRCDYVSQH